METQFGLIADIGGTNARFALVPLGDLVETLHLGHICYITSLSVKAFANIDDAISHYLSSLPATVARPVHAVMAIACPTDQDTIRMTNTDWVFSVSALKAHMRFDSLAFINDFFAVASAVPSLSQDDVVAIGDGESIPHMPCVVTGAGTGLGLGALVFDSRGSAITVQGEGGHIHFAPLDADEQFVFDYLRAKHHRVSVERVVSGQGIENIFEALYFRAHAVKFRMSAVDISRHALANSNALCVQTLNMFCAIFGSFAGDAALMYGARGGVYIGGGIMPRMIDFVQQSQFRARFVSKARLSAYVIPIPTYIITCDQPGLLGAGAVLRHRVSQ